MIIFLNECILKCVNSMCKLFVEKVFIAQKRKKMNKKCFRLEKDINLNEDNNVKSLIEIK